MNVENFRLLIDTISESDTYNQRIFSHTCEAPACIAGHAAVLAGYNLANESGYWEYGHCYLDEESYYIPKVAAEWLEINNPANAHWMFFSWCHDETTKEAAIAMLENYVETEEVDWLAIERKEK